MKRKKKKEKEEILEIEKEIEEMIDPSVEQFTKEDRETICRYIG